MDLASDDPPPDYAHQVDFAPVAQGPEATAEAELQDIIRGCLHSYARKRLQAADVANKLFSIMLRNGWARQV